MRLIFFHIDILLFRFILLYLIILVCWLEINQPFPFGKWKNHLTTYRWVYSGFSVLFHWSLCVYLYWYHNVFILSWNLVRQVLQLFFSKIIFVILGPSHFHINLKSVCSVQSLSRVRFFVTPWTAARQASLSITNSWSLPKLMSIESVMPSSHLILCHPLLLPLSVFLSIRVFSNESPLCIRWPKYWSFSFNISPSNEYSGLISFKIVWLDLLAIQGTLKSLLQYHTSKASILLRSAFFIVLLLHPYMTTGKNHSLD